MTRLDDNSETPDWLEILDHTADTGIVVVADGYPELFSRAALGMFQVIGETSAVKPSERREIRVEAEDRAALLTRWLSELNFLHITEEMMFSRFEVEFCEETKLIAAAYGERIDPSRHVIHTEIKAVTFHGLQIEQGERLCRAQVIFDL